ncbi:MAG: hypothetical protein ACLR4Z_16990 [Butyricicoccaceae bacterium]
MFIGEKKIDRPFRWGIVGGGRTSGVGYKHRLGAMRDNTSFVLKAAAFDLDFARCVDFGKNLNMDEERLYPITRPCLLRKQSARTASRLLTSQPRTSSTLRSARPLWKPACM